MVVTCRSERAQRPGYANAGGGEVLVTTSEHHFGPIGPEFLPSNAQVQTRRIASTSRSVVSTLEVPQLMQHTPAQRPSSMSQHKVFSKQKMALRLQYHPGNRLAASLLDLQNCLSICKRCNRYLESGVWLPVSQALKVTLSSSKQHC